MRRIIGIIGALVLAGGVASAKGAGQQSMQDQQFLNKAYSINMGEVRTAELAQQKASSPQVKQYAQRLMKDHQKSLEDLRKAAQKDDMMLPTQIAPEQQQTYTQLSQLSGPQFDRAYLQDQQTGHQEAIQAFRQEADTGTSKNLKRYAQKTLPTLQEHQQMASQHMRQLEQQQPSPTGTMPGGQQQMPGGQQQMPEQQQQMPGQPQQMPGGQQQPMPEQQQPQQPPQGY